MNTKQLESTARAMVSPGKGILAMDESTPTMGKRLKEVGLENEESVRRAYREMLLTTPRLGEHISAVILFDETIRQTTTTGIPLIDVVYEQGIIPGIKVDAGAKDFSGHPGEKITEGLDGLRDRLIEYHQLGARFAKWRAVITIGNGIPSRACIEANAHALARYAGLCQEANMVPIVEPEVLIDGNHTIEHCFEATEETQHALFDQLYRLGVHLPGVILKASMVLSGKECSVKADVDEVARETIRCLRRTVPAAVPGVAFLSGGQADQEATAHLNAINKMGKEMSLPWRLTFSYARALQHPVLTAWHGDNENAALAQKILRHRAKCNGLASMGNYDKVVESEAVV